MGAGLVVLSGLSTWVGAGGTPARAAQDAVTQRMFDCVDPGHCGGITRSSGEAVRDGDLAAATFASSWARDWNRWADVHVVPQQILTVGCHYLSTEHYYLCAVRVTVDPPSAPGASCGLIVVGAKLQAGPNDRIVNGLETTCHIFSTYPRQVVPPWRPWPPASVEPARRADQRTRW
jgi:hypothetical protein